MKTEQDVRMRLEYAAFKYGQWITDAEYSAQTDPDPVKRALYQCVADEHWKCYNALMRELSRAVWEEVVTQ